MRKVCVCIILIAVLSFTVTCEANTLPLRYDLRDYGRITSVKDQGKFAVCGVFAAFGAMESNYLTLKLNTDGKKIDLSEMHLAFFAYMNPIRERSFT